MRELLAIGMIASGLSGQGASIAEKGQPEKTLVFVCEHGSVKSLIAAQWFNKLAAERGIAMRAVSRGLTPDLAVPPAIVSHLGEDGLAPMGFVPKAFSQVDLRGAERIIAIGVDPAVFTKGGSAPVESWKDIPPASENYAASRDALRARIEPLLKSLAKSNGKDTPPVDRTPRSTLDAG